ncbi:hypothetical protein FNN09_07525 [Carboxylicivirga sp. M1479]|nr:hypothetical protein FNN09_07525 [Carboxylicivirga sp. M1479]
MKKAKDLDEYETHWRNFLNDLEKVWIKSERECQDLKNKFQPWQGKFKRERRTFSLLKYLKNARDADVHSIHEIVEKSPGSTAINFANKKGGHIKEIKFENGAITKYEGDPIVAKIKAPKIEACTFTNNGQTFVPPQNYRGVGLKNPRNPIELAQKGIEYYENYLEQIEANF